VRDDQVNVQIPWELKGMASAQLRVWFGDYGTASYSFPLNDVSPAAFEWIAPSGRRLFAAQDVNYGVIYETNPIRRGQTIVLYMNGLGPVDNQPVSGEPTPGSPLARALGDVRATIGGRPATVAFAGMTPYSIGLYQVNVVVPDDAPVLYQPVIITVNGVASKPADVYIQ
jgi:uncharacterized protein (TIGR03437 family)